ncbi:LOXE3 isomerase, partial [Rhinopomastus cyanomelas]|nr:LOXE3 isomerase [Rhinopomastus cyanomelas]
MRQPPPTSKAPLTESQFLEALPAMNTTVITLGVLWVLRNEPFDMRHFTQEPPRRLMRKFRRRLA